MKSLRSIQVLSKIGRILSKIVFVCSIIGFCGCIVGILSLAVGAQTLKIGSVAFMILIANSANQSIGTLYAIMTSCGILCIGESVIAKFADRYFARELADGTPFTLSGAKEMLRLGILCICFSAGTTLLAAIAQGVIAQMFDSVDKMELQCGESIALGAAFIVVSLICRSAVEVIENKKSLNEDCVRLTSNPRRRQSA